MSKLTAPTLPEGWRFKVTTASDPLYVSIELQQKGLLFWNEKATEWSVPNAEDIHRQMVKLQLQTGQHNEQFNGVYPPRQEL